MFSWLVPMATLSILVPSEGFVARARGPATVSVASTPISPLQGGLCHRRT